MAKGSRTRERAVLRAVAARARGLGYEVRKAHGSPYSGAGWPDLEILGGSGRVCMVEVKADRDERPTAIQRAVARRLIQSGIPVLLCRDKGDVDRVSKAIHENLSGVSEITVDDRDEFAEPTQEPESATGAAG